MHSVLLWIKERTKFGIPIKQSSSTQKPWRSQKRPTAETDWKYLSRYVPQPGYNIHYGKYKFHLSDYRIAK